MGTQLPLKSLKTLEKTELDNAPDIASGICNNPNKETGPFSATYIRIFRCEYNLQAER